MAEPKTSRPGFANDDAGFPPVHEADDSTPTEEDAVEDYESDFHEEGGGD